MGIGWSNCNWFSRSGDDGIKSIMFVGCIFNSANSTISFVEAVFTYNFVTITAFVLWVEVAGVFVFNAVRELVFGVSLDWKKNLVPTVKKNYFIRTYSSCWRAGAALAAKTGAACNNGAEWSNGAYDGTSGLTCCVKEE